MAVSVGWRGANCLTLSIVLTYLTYLPVDNLTDLIHESEEEFATLSKLSSPKRGCKYLGNKE
jgi:hypothetical protein